MTTFESKTTINKPVNTVYSFLSDFNNHRQLMPDAIQNWNSTFNEASFDIPNMTKLALKIGERVENKLIKIIPAAKPPFDVTLSWNLLAQGDNTTITFSIVADLNMMMKMMASGPLQKLADQQVKNLGVVIGD
jgi:carbon monoxide dehydrogenase subunit G